MERAYRELKVSIKGCSKKEVLWNKVVQKTLVKIRER